MDTRKKLRWLGLVLLAVVVLRLAGCSKPADPFKDIPGGPTRVLVTIPPLYCFTKAVAGDDAAVLCLLTSQGPHDYEAGFNDILKARKANLFLAVGLGLDEFAEKVAKASGNDRLKSFEVGEKGVPDDMLLAGHEEDAKAKKDEHHHHGEHDPHVWLGIPQAIKMVDYIKTTLQEVDGKNKDAYAKRAAAYTEELEKLQKEGRAALKDKKNKKLIAMHESLRYFANSFGLEILGSIQPRPGIEADSAQMAKLVKLCKAEDVRVIAIEPQYKTAGAETLKKELANRGIEVELVEVDPLETVAPEDLKADYYLAKMRQNITNLAKKLR